MSRQSTSSSTRISTRSAGFSLVELLLVVVVITTLSAIAVPRLLHASRRAQEGAAVGRMRNLHIAQENYHLLHGYYADSFAELPGLHSGGSESLSLVRSGYEFRLRRATLQTWNVIAIPLSEHERQRYFYADESGIIRYDYGETPTSLSPVWRPDENSKDGGE